VANLSKTLHTNFYQNRSTFAEVMHKSSLVCFLCPTVYIRTNLTFSDVKIHEIFGVIYFMKYFAKCL